MQNRDTKGTGRKKTPAMKPDKTNPWDQAVVNLTNNHFNAGLIARKTGLTPAQVRYRRKVFDLEIPRDFRGGRSKEAKEVLRRVDAMLARIHGIWRLSQNRKGKRVG